MTLLRLCTHDACREATALRVIALLHVSRALYVGVWCVWCVWCVVCMCVVLVHGVVWVWCGVVSGWVVCGVWCAWCVVLCGMCVGVHWCVVWHVVCGVWCVGVVCPVLCVHVVCGVVW